MAWIESHQQLGNHPKTRRLARLLDVPRTSVVGNLHFLWWWALDYAQDGDLSLFEPGDIADAAMWEEDPDQFYQALKDCGGPGKSGFVDDDDNLHDWYEFAGKLIERRKANAERKREARASKKEDVPEASAGHPQDVPETSGATEQNRTKPNKTKKQTPPTPSKPDDVPEETWKDFLALRKEKRAPPTKTALDGIAREAAKAGVSLTTALETCCECGWAGFKAEWIRGKSPPGKKANGLDTLRAIATGEVKL